MRPPKIFSHATDHHLYALIFNLTFFKKIHLILRFTLPTFIFLFCLFSCGEKKKTSLSRDEEVKNSAISLVKSFSDSVSNVPYSPHVRAVIMDFQNLISTVVYMKNQKWNSSSAFSDFYSFFSPDITYLSESYCISAISCPNVICNSGCQEGSKGEENQDISGNYECEIKTSGGCYNDYFVFSGSGNLKVYQIVSDVENIATSTYEANFSNWRIESVETGEFVLYNGKTSFISKKQKQNNSVEVKRDISIGGVADVIDEGSTKSLKNIDFQHTFYLKINPNSNTDFDIEMRQYDFMNSFCFALIQLPFFDFKCVRSGEVKEISIHYSETINDSGEKRISIKAKGNAFKPLKVKGEVRWVDMNFNLELIYIGGICRILNGEISITGKYDTLKLVFDSRNYGDRGCIFDCPSYWEWESAEGQRYVKSDCLPPLSGM